MHSIEILRDYFRNRIAMFALGPRALPLLQRRLVLLTLFTFAPVHLHAPRFRSLEVQDLQIHPGPPTR